MKKWVIATSFWIVLYASVKLYAQHSWINFISVIIVWVFVTATLVAKVVYRKKRNPCLLERTGPCLAPTLQWVASV